MRRPDPFRLLLSSLVAALLAAGWATGCGEPSAGGPDSAVAPAADASQPADASPAEADAAAGRADAAVQPADAAAPLPDASASSPDASAQPEDAAAPGEDAAAHPADASQPVDDAGAAADAGVAVPLPGFGTISGACGVLDTELTDAIPHYFENRLDFGTDPYDDPADRPQLTTGGQKIMADPNAGGSSKISEAFAFEMLARCELAALLKTETEIVYVNPAGKITDELVDIDANKIGLSITRAMSFPDETVAYTDSQATTLVSKKLQGVLDSTANVSTGDKWVKQVLLILAQTDTHAAAIKKAYDAQSATLKADTIVIVTVTEGSDRPVYYDNP